MADLRPYQREEGGLQVALQRPLDRFRARSLGSVSVRQELAAPLGLNGELLAYRLTLETLWALAERDRPAEVEIELWSSGGELGIGARFRSVQGARAG